MILDLFEIETVAALGMKLRKHFTSDRNLEISNLHGNGFSLLLKQ